MNITALIIALASLAGTIPAIILAVKGKTDVKAVQAQFKAHIDGHG